MSFKNLLLVLASSGLCFAQTAYQQAAIDKHNELRAKHGGPDVEYDAGLEATAIDCATKYVTKVQVPHQCKPKGVGENAFGASGYGNDEVNLVTIAIQDWYDEISGYNYEDPGNSQGVTGHFTQVVWKESVKVGCGVAIAGNDQSVVCQYSPQGNMGWGGEGDYYQFYKQNVVPPQ